jgi:hypothetical protein
MIKLGIVGAGRTKIAPGLGTCTRNIFVEGIIESKEDYSSIIHTSRKVES